MWRGSLSSVHFSRSVISNSLWPHGLQHARLPCPSPTPGAYSNSCPSHWWCHSTISYSVMPFSSHLQSFPASGSFQMSQFFPSGGQSIGVSASASVNIGLNYTVLLQRPLGSRSEWVPTPVPQLGVCSEVLPGHRFCSLSGSDILHPFLPPWRSLNSSGCAWGGFQPAGTFLFSEITQQESVGVCLWGVCFPTLPHLQAF